MSKRHNRKRTRSRPRHRDAAKAHSNHTHIRTLSMDTNSSSYSTAFPLPSPNFPSTLAHAPSQSWHSMYLWQNHVYYQQEREKARMEDAAQRLRFFGHCSEIDEVSLSMEQAMLKVVTDLFDGNTDYEDP